MEADVVFRCSLLCFSSRTPRRGGGAPLGGRRARLSCRERVAGIMRMLRSWPRRTRWRRRTRRCGTPRQPLRPAVSCRIEPIRGQTCAGRSRRAAQQLDTAAGRRVCACVRETPMPGQWRAAPAAKECRMCRLRRARSAGVAGGGEVERCCASRCVARCPAPARRSATRALVLHSACRRFCSLRRAASTRASRPLACYKMPDALSAFCRIVLLRTHVSLGCRTWPSVPPPLTP